MPIRRLRVYTNCDEATIIWQTDQPIGGCRGFALEREIKGETGTTILPTWVGFKGQPHKSGESRPSTEWPIQRFIWSDYGVAAGQQSRYRVIPMLGPAGSLEKAPSKEWSAWSDWVRIDTCQSEGLKAYFNRGLIPAQWLARQKPSRKSLQQDIQNPRSRNRRFLGGVLRDALIELLKQAKTDGVEIHAALYELNDPELIEAIQSIGPKCNLILGSGAYKGANKKTGAPAVPDENEDVREELKQHSQVNVHDRLVKSPHFAHNKFVVFSDRKGQPVSVWTGSTNWTVTGLCTQINNGILIENKVTAQAYKERWEALQKAGSRYPASLSSTAVNATTRLGQATITVWNTPVAKLADLNEANGFILRATEGVLFLMFNPGPRNTLLHTIMGLDPQKIFIHGLVNQDPGGSKAPLLKLIHKGQPLTSRLSPAILPAGLSESGNWFDKTFTFNRVMVHSKVIVLDPFGDNPIVMTGSHNLGPKASSKNDDNLVIIANAPGLAAEYAVNILGAYGHFKWLYNQALKATAGRKKGVKKSPQYDGNYDHDQWQEWYTKGPNLREIEFWLG